MAASGDIELKDLEQRILDELEPSEDECRIEVPLARTQKKETNASDETHSNRETPRLPFLVRNPFCIENVLSEGGVA
jgi:hypothetical protein